MEWFVKEHTDKLSNDVILISDTGMISNSQPSITTGLTRLSYMEVTVTGPNRDLHSGLYGGAVANPINILTQMIAQLQDRKQSITIPGFYEQCRRIIPKKKEQKWQKPPFLWMPIKMHLDINDVHGEKGFTTNERNSIRPTLDVNGIWGGYTWTKEQKQ